MPVTVVSCAHRPLVDLIRTSRSTTVQVKAASALEALAKNNPNSQRIFLDLDAPKALIRLLKVHELSWLRDAAHYHASQFNCTVNEQHLPGTQDQRLGVEQDLAVAHYKSLQGSCNCTLCGIIHAQTVFICVVKQKIRC